MGLLREYNKIMKHWKNHPHKAKPVDVVEHYFIEKKMDSLKNKLKKKRILKMNNNKLLAKKIKFVKKHKNEFKKSKASGLGFIYDLDFKRLILLARKEIGYSSATINQDIHNSLMKVYKGLYD